MKKNEFIHLLRENWTLWAVLWLILNFLQASLTYLYEDEAYYWMFSQRLDWGYFDHPPMVALFIKVGYSIFHNELGVRLLGIISSLLTLRIIWEMIELPNKKNYTWLFFGLALCLPFFQIYSFIITPDAPMLLFGSSTLLAYRFFIKNPTWRNVLFFAFSSAALMYSKYHGGLFIILIILSNWRLLLQPKFYLVGIVALLLYAPHLHWQYMNDFPSFNYHLSGRVLHHRWWYIPEYWLNQFLVFNPLLLIVLFPFFQKKHLKTEDHFTKTLHYILFGFVLFFFLTSLQMRHIEPQWTVLGMMAFLIISFKIAVQRPLLIKRLKWVIGISCMIFLLARMQLMFRVIPNISLSRYTPQMVKEIDELTEGKPIIFTNSFQNTSLHSFYGNSPFTWGQTTTQALRDNQYSFWDIGDTINHQSVYFISTRIKFYENKTTKLSNGKTIYYRLVDDFQNIKNVKITPIEPLPSVFEVGDTVELQFSIENPYDYDIKFNYLGMYATIGKNLYRNRNIPIKKKMPQNILEKNSSMTITGKMVIPDKKGDWKLNFALQQKVLPMLYHSDFTPITIK